MKIISLYLLRWALGLLFIATAIGKLLDNRGFADVLQNYRLFPTLILLPLGLLLSLSELILGIELIRQPKPFWPSWGIFLMNLGYAVLAAVTNLRGLNLNNCGCFGVFWARPMTWNTVTEDIILTAVSFAFCILLSRKTKEPYFSKGYPNEIKRPI